MVTLGESNRYPTTRRKALPANEARFLVQQDLSICGATLCRDKAKPGLSRVVDELHGSAYWLLEHDAFSGDVVSDEELLAPT